MEKYFETGEFGLLQLTEKLSKEVIYCERLIFLCKFGEFKSNMLRGGAVAAKQAGSLIVELLEAPKLIPFKYKKRVLYELHPLVKQVHSSLQTSNIFFFY